MSRCLLHDEKRTTTCWRWSGGSRDEATTLLPVSVRQRLSTPSRRRGSCVGLKLQLPTQQCRTMSEKLRLNRWQSIWISRRIWRSRWIVTRDALLPETTQIREELNAQSNETSTCEKPHAFTSQCAGNPFRLPRCGGVGKTPSLPLPLENLLAPGGVLVKTVSHLLHHGHRIAYALKGARRITPGDAQSYEKERAETHRIEKPYTSTIIVLV